MFLFSLTRWVASCFLNLTVFLLKLKIPFSSPHTSNCYDWNKIRKILFVEISFTFQFSVSVVFIARAYH